MTQGTVLSYDSDDGKGYIRPDHDTDENEKIAFDKDSLAGGEVREGDRVSFDLEGGMVGVFAKNVRRI